MLAHPRRLVERLFRSAACLPLAGLLAVAGCGNPGEGTARVSPEARARLAPPLPVAVKGTKNHLVQERQIGIKGRGALKTK